MNIVEKNVMIFGMAIGFSIFASFLIVDGQILLGIALGALGIACVSYVRDE